MLSNFLKNFPPPKYIDMPFTGIIFSDNSIRMLILDKKNLHPTFFDEIALEPGIIEKGKVVNEEALAKILSDKAVKLPSAFVKFTIPDETSYVFTSKVPVVSGKSAEESVSFILEENVPLPLPDTTFDYEIQKIENTQEGYMAKISVVASSVSTINSYISALRKALLEPIVCVNESQAVAYSIVPNEWHDTVAIVHIHKQSIGIYVTNGHYVEFSSVMPVPPKDSPEEIIKNLKLELERAIEYWSAKQEKAGKTVENIRCYVCGEYESIENLNQQIFEIGGVSPLLANVWVNAFSIDDYLPQISFEESLRFAPAIGLFLNGS